MLTAHTYNFFAAWYFLGLAGFPDGAWLLLELIVELIVLFDFFLRMYLQVKMPNQWQTMWLLQHREERPEYFH